jgi:hypothetical protein
VSKASYWYLEFSDEPKQKELPDLSEAHTKILDIGRKIKLARKLTKLECPNGKDGCPQCKPLESIIKGEGEMVGIMGRKDTYILESQKTTLEDMDDSFII